MPDADDALKRTDVEITTLRRRVAELEAEGARLERDRAELQALYTEAPVGLCLVDRDLRIVRISGRLAELSGHPVEAHLGRRIDEMFPDLARGALSILGRVLRTGKPVVHRELRVSLPPDPSLDQRWLVDSHPVRSSDGAVVGAISVLQDVTLLKATVDELRRTRERLAQALRVAGVGSWEWDLESDRVWWSSELYRMVGRQQGFFTPSFQAFIDHVHPDDRSAIRKQLDATFGQDEPYAVTFRAVRPTGEVRVIRAHAELTRAPDGTPLRLVGTAQDVTLDSVSE